MSVCFHYKIFNLIYNKYLTSRGGWAGSRQRSYHMMYSLSWIELPNEKMGSHFYSFISVSLPLLLFLPSDSNFFRISVARRSSLWRAGNAKIPWVSVRLGTLMILWYIFFDGIIFKVKISYSSEMMTYRYILKCIHPETKGRCKYLWI